MSALSPPDFSDSRLESSDGRFGSKRDIVDFVRGFSTETTPGLAARIPSFREYLPAGVPVYVAYMPGSDFDEVIRTARRLREEGFRPVPHLSARSIASARQLEAYLAALRGEAGIEEVLVIAGGQERPLGPYPGAMDLLKTGLLERYGIRRIGVAGHPEGNREIGEARLRAALEQKNAFAERTGLELYLVTQFCFDARPVIAWCRTIHGWGNRLPIHVGLPGCARLKHLINYARICGVGPSVRVLMRSAGGLAKLAAVSTPDRLVTGLARYRAAEPSCGIRRAHFFPLGAFGRTVRWVEEVEKGRFTLRADGAGFTLDSPLE